MRFSTPDSHRRSRPTKFSLVFPRNNYSPSLSLVGSSPETRSMATAGGGVDRATTARHHSGCGPHTVAAVEGRERPPYGSDSAEGDGRHHRSSTSSLSDIAIDDGSKVYNYLERFANRQRGTKGADEVVELPRWEAIINGMMFLEDALPSFPFYRSAFLSVP